MRDPSLHLLIAFPLPCVALRMGHDYHRKRVANSCSSPCTEIIPLYNGNRSMGVPNSTCKADHVFMLGWWLPLTREIARQTVQLPASITWLCLLLRRHSQSWQRFITCEAPNQQPALQDAITSPKYLWYERTIFSLLCSDGNQFRLPSAQPALFNQFTCAAWAGLVYFTVVFSFSFYSQWYISWPSNFIMLSSIANWHPYEAKSRSTTEYSTTSQISQHKIMLFNL